TEVEVKLPVAAVRPVAPQTPAAAPLSPRTATGAPRVRSAPAPSAALSPLFAAAKESIENRHYGEAHKVLRQCVEAEPRNADCHLLLGQLFALEHDYRGEAAEYRAFLSLAPPAHPDRWWVTDILAEHDWTAEL